VTVTDDDTTTTNTDDAIQLSANIHISDSGGTTSDEVTVDLVGGPPSTRREKRIDGPIASLVPNEDLSIQFFVCEPSDGVFYSKLDDADDTDFVRPIPTPSIQFSELRLGLTGASGNVSTVRSVQFALKLRDASFTSVNNPIVKMDLYKSQDLGERITGYDIQLYGTETSVWLRSPVISVSINKIDVPNLVLRIRPRASDYAFVSYKATISAAMVDVSGDAPEKVIG
jgi:hypothetical protein